jgi:beta-1,4-mannosyltransferase
VVCLYAALRGVNVIIDWHNLGFTMIALALGPIHKHSMKYKAVTLYRIIEMKCAQFAHGHYCVTHAMKDYLSREFHIEATPLHDCPPSFFGASTDDLALKHDLFRRLHQE